jgi:hypothetical protein
MIRQRRVAQRKSSGNIFGYTEAGPSVEEESKAPRFARRERSLTRLLLF